MTPTIANACVLIAALMPIVTVGMAKASTAGKKRREGGYDNNDPRSWMAQLGGWQSRAAAAQNNGFEALPLFVFGVLIAQMAGLDQARTDMLAASFIGLRVLYTVVYLANLAALRSVVWFAALIANVMMFTPLLRFALPF